MPAAPLQTVDADHHVGPDQSPPAHAWRVRRMHFAGGSDAEFERDIPVESPVAVMVGGQPYAVMMASPTDLADFAVGFALAEGLIERTDELARLLTEKVNGGWRVRLTLTPTRALQVSGDTRARRRAAESSCGLCGVEEINQVLRPLPRLAGRLSVERAAIQRALAALDQHQPVGRATGAMHAAAFCDAKGSIRCVREDVGRHNALDKLIGALRRDGQEPAMGFILLTARCSFELVEKTVRAGCPLLVTISAPTSLAVERAAGAGLTLVSLARADSALVVCDPHGNLAG